MISIRLLLAMVGVGLLAGCRPKDPLEWKVEGRTGVRLQAWLDASTAEMPPDLAIEFGRAVGCVRDRTVGWARAHPEATGNPLVLRLTGRTVRDILIEGLQIENEQRLSSIQNDLEFVRRVIDRVDQPGGVPTDPVQLERRLTRLHARIEAAKAEMARVEKRIGQLRRGSSP